jgi:hypothetical protein
MAEPKKDEMMSDENIVDSASEEEIIDITDDASLDDVVGRA